MKHNTMRGAIEDWTYGSLRNLPRCTGNLSISPRGTHIGIKRIVFVHKLTCHVLIAIIYHKLVTLRNLGSQILSHWISCRKPYSVSEACCHTTHQVHICELLGKVGENLPIRPRPTKPHVVRFLLPKGDEALVGTETGTLTQDVPCRHGLNCENRTGIEIAMFFMPGGVFREWQLPARKRKPIDQNTIAGMDIGSLAST